MGESPAAGRRTIDTPQQASPSARLPAQVGAVLQHTAHTHTRVCTPSDQTDQCTRTPLYRSTVEHHQAPSHRIVLHAVGRLGLSTFTRNEPVRTTDLFKANRFKFRRPSPCLGSFPYAQRTVAKIQKLTATALGLCIAEQQTLTCKFIDETLVHKYRYSTL